jgi:DNA-binding NtrC family response regulator
MILKDDNLETILINGGNELFAKILSRPLYTSVAIVDLPFNSGEPEIYRTIATLRKSFPRIGVLLMSGYLGEEIISLQLLQKRVTFIRKPFRPPVLLAAIRDLVQQV